MTTTSHCIYLERKLWKRFVWKTLYKFLISIGKMNRECILYFFDFLEGFEIVYEFWKFWITILITGSFCVLPYGKPKSFLLVGRILLVLEYVFDLSENFCCDFFIFSSIILCIYFLSSLHDSLQFRQEHVSNIFYWMICSFIRCFRLQSIVPSGSSKISICIWIFSRSWLLPIKLICTIYSGSFCHAKNWGYGIHKSLSMRIV